MMALTVCSINVRSVAGAGRCGALMQYLMTVQADILCLQECCLPFRSNYAEWERQWTGGPSFWSGDCGNRNSGVAVLIRNRGILVRHTEVLQDGRALGISFSFAGDLFYLVNVYASPNKQERCDLFVKLQSMAVTRRHFLLVGDFNTSLVAAERSSGAALDRSSTLLQHMVKDFKLVDCFRVTNPGVPGFSWFASGGNGKSRIDFVFASKGLVPARSSLLPVFFSDHLLLRVEFVVPTSAPYGRGVWKLNLQLLDDMEGGLAFAKAYGKWQSLKCLCATKAEWWDMIKGRIREFFVCSGRMRASRERKVLCSLQGKLQRLFRLREAGFAVMEDIRGVQQRIGDIFVQRNARVVFLGKEAWVENNEKCSRFFFKKVFEANREMGGLTDEYGALQEGTDAMCRVAEAFYSMLYAEKATNDSLLPPVLEGLGGCLSSEQSDFLSKDFLMAELEMALAGTRSGKSPGGDGLPAEFYKKHWHLIREDLLEVLQEVAQSGTLPVSFREGVITLLYKKGDRKDLRNWRPITLLNTDYKLFAKVLALRLRTVLQFLIHQDQVCAVPGRRIADSLILLRDSICYVQQRNSPLFLINLDFEKAYDRMAHKFLFDVLRKLGLPDPFIAWVRAMYTGISSRILINGWQTDRVAIASGVRQGCPLSALLFICCVEPLGCMIRDDRSITGVHVPGGGGLQNKCVLYMDDINLLCVDVYSVQKALGHAETFCQVSGSKLNLAKCQCLLYNVRGDQAPNGIQIVPDCIKVLGILFDRTGGGEIGHG